MKQLEQALIEGYQIQRHLAQGGMANVYLAYDVEKDQTVAIKMVHEGAGEYSKRFQREVKAMAGLAHEHILPVFDYGEYESWYFLVTPYIEYGTLSGRLADGPLTLEETDPILRQLAAALQFAHEQGIVHRDVKPSNVLMRDGNHVYLADFGLVKRVGQETGLTVSGYLIGTPEYLAPELAEEDATPQSDVYSLGILLYQMLAGRVPFKANTPMGVYLRHIRDKPQAPSIFNPDIPAEVECVILRAIDKDPQQRYQSAQELYQAYQQALKNVMGESTEKRRILVPAAAESLASKNTEQVMLAPDIQPAQVSIRIVKQKRGMARPLAAAVLCIAFFILLALFPGWQSGHIYTANAESHKPSAPLASAKHTIPIIHIAPALTMVSVTPTPKPKPSPAAVPASYGNSSGYDNSQNNDDDDSGGSRSSPSSRVATAEVMGVVVVGDIAGDMEEVKTYNITCADY